MPIELAQRWNTFLAAELGAAAALCGLLFVAVSINLKRILEFAHLPGRAAESLLDLIGVVFVATFALIPGQSIRALGIEIALTGLFVWAAHTRSFIRSREYDRQYIGFTVRFLVNQLPPLPFVISGILFISGRLAGLYWIVPGVLLSFASGLFGAWVLLIEIQR